MSKTYWTIAGLGAALIVAWLLLRQDPQAVAVTRPDVREPDAATATTPEVVDFVRAGTRANAKPGTKSTPASSDAAVSQSPVKTYGAVDAYPIDVSPGFEYLNTLSSTLKDTDPRKPSLRRHEELQNEPRDPSWAERMESALRAAIEAELTAHKYDTQRIEMPVVECRSTGCEIQALGYVQDNRKEGADLQLILFKILGSSLGSEFDRNSFYLHMSSRPDDRITFFVLLGRKEN